MRGTNPLGHKCANDWTISKDTKHAPESTPQTLTTPPLLALSKSHWRQRTCDTQRPNHVAGSAEPNPRAEPDSGPLKTVETVQGKREKKREKP
ncbi:hypothetical protein L484_018974 [Morus notabilis]|uniref:Uncharacterized protein n=1 Tax=Morus notabilis TaxID=981085 RepID=W9RV84_9ROSA|nr:hypothetical protein L484_018974 [Morus notabilis]